MQGKYLLLMFLNFYKYQARQLSHNSVLACTVLLSIRRTNHLEMMLQNVLCNSDCHY